MIPQLAGKELAMRLVAPLIIPSLLAFGPTLLPKHSVGRCDVPRSHEALGPDKAKVVTAFEAEGKRGGMKLSVKAVRSPLGDKLVLRYSFNLYPGHNWVFPDVTWATVLVSVPDKPALVRIPIRIWFPKDYWRKAGAFAETQVISVPANARGIQMQFGDLVTPVARINRHR
jgi:hypothetical protein